MTNFLILKVARGRDIAFLKSRGPVSVADSHLSSAESVCVDAGGPLEPSPVHTARVRETPGLGRHHQGIKGVRT